MTTAPSAATTGRLQGISVSARVGLPHRHWTSQVFRGASKNTFVFMHKVDMGPSRSTFLRRTIDEPDMRATIALRLPMTLQISNVSMILGIYRSDDCVARHQA